jgi:hypothetical protein
MSSAIGIPRKGYRLIADCTLRAPRKSWSSVEVGSTLWSQTTSGGHFSRCGRRAEYVAQQTNARIKVDSGGLADSVDEHDNRPVAAYSIRCRGRRESHIVGCQAAVRRQGFQVADLLAYWLAKALEKIAWVRRAEHREAEKFA